MVNALPWLKVLIATCIQTISTNNTTCIQRNSPVIFMLLVGLSINPFDDSALLSSDVRAPPALSLALIVPEHQRLRHAQAT